MKSTYATHMENGVMLKFRNLFENELQKLVYSQSFTNESFYVQQDDLFDFSDLTSSEIETSMRMQLRNRESFYVKKIYAALKRIEEGTFGECENCEEPIGMKRLEARPTATVCVSCKEEQEHSESVYMDGRKIKSLGTRVRLA